MKIINLVLILSVIISASIACNLPSTSNQPTEDVVRIVAQTQTAIAIQEFLTATTTLEQELPVSPTSTQTGIPPTATLTPVTPTATITLLSECTDKAQFISETIPDYMEFSPGSPFSKSWTIKNIGTCTWTPEYSLAIIQGEAMSSPSMVPFGQTIHPGEVAELTLSLIAPSGPGEYTGYWKLRNARGQDFGNLWVKIKVTEAITNDLTGLGTPTWIETFTNNASFALGTSDGTDFEINNGNLVISALSPQGDKWRISNKGYMDDFFIEAQFTTGPTCVGKDSYGLVIRAPDQPDDIIDSTYVITFSCEGKYRVYRMDNGVFTSIQTWTANANIKTGPGKTNLLGIKAKGNNIQIYANGNQIFEFNDNSYSTGYFGLTIRADSTNNFQVYINEIRYWDLSP